MTKLLHVSSYTRRAPIDPYAAIKAAKTEQLRFEVALDRMAKALEAECDNDPDFMQRLGFAPCHAR